MDRGWLAKVLDAIGKANQESGGSVVEMAETEYMVRSRGYLRTLEDFRNILLSANEAGTPVLLRDVATVRLGPEMRRGIAEFNGEGEVAGGVVVMRSGKNALDTIKAVKAKLASLQTSLPKGVEVVPVYDRSKLITAAVTNLRDKLIEEFVVVAIVCAMWLTGFDVPSLSNLYLDKPLKEHTLLQAIARVNRYAAQRRGTHR